jgi:uncharacterized membrane protein YccC
MNVGVTPIMARASASSSTVEDQSGLLQSKRNLRLPKNPSEIQRLTEEAEAIRENLRTNIYRDKASKEKLLQELHAIERQLGNEESCYNSSDF